jgi:hypothetical protein
MFRFAVAFNQRMGGWNVSRVGSMEWMFFGASSFDQDLAHWDVRHIQLRPFNFDGGNVTSVHAATKRDNPRMTILLVGRRGRRRRQPGDAGIAGVGRWQCGIVDDHRKAQVGTVKILY